MKYVAFLRAINVSGRVVKMEALRGHVEALGFTDVATHIASGNLIFKSISGQSSVKAAIEKHLQASLGFEVATFVRTIGEVGAVARYQPFAKAAIASAGAFCVGFLNQPLDQTALEAVMGLRTPIDDFHVHKREVYWLCAKKQSESAFSNAKLERLLSVPATIRSMNTVANLAAKYAI